MDAGRPINPNTLWAGTVVDQLARCGLRAVCIAPGSRSVPLVLAFDQHPKIDVYLHLDERSAAFFALGVAQATKRPVALVCTSGTAAAEFHPAIVEAHQAQLPLLVLTADRPPELRHSGANQTIDQVKMFGDHVLWAVDVALPEPNPPGLALRNLRTLVSRAYAVADGLVKGAVHLNFPFRQPLEPASLEELALMAAGNSEEASGSPPASEIERGQLYPSPTQIERIAEVVARHERGIIVCGPRCPGGDFPSTVTALAKISGYPLLADPVSGVRFGPHVADAPIIGGYETFLAANGLTWAPPQVVIRFGAMPTSKSLNSYLDRVAQAQIIHIRESGIWADDSHRVHYFLQADPAIVCRCLAEKLASQTPLDVGSQLPARPDPMWPEQPRATSKWAAALLETEATTQHLLRQSLAECFFDGAAVASAVNMLPPGTNLFVGNSLPIRHLDQFAQPTARALSIFANRGASGIDGVTSTALGVAVADRSRPTILITGDIAFYHDMNGLFALRQHDLRRFIIILLNNNGGGIFRRLPIARFEPSFTSLFLTPHDLKFEAAAQMYGLAHQAVNDGEHFQAAFAESLGGETPTIIEVRTDSHQDHIRHQEVVRQVIAALNEQQAEYRLDS